MENIKYQLSKSAKYLLASDTIYSLIGLFIDTFLVAYFLEVTNDSIIQISLFWMIVYAVLGVGITLLGRIVKTKIRNYAKILSIGIVLRAFFILLIVMLKEKISTYFCVVAVLYGISEVFYWIAHETICIDVTTNDNRRNYMSIKKILGKIMRMVAPIILGASIELYSFTKIAIYIFLFSFIQIIVSLKIEAKTNAMTDINQYSMNDFWKSLDVNQIKKIRTYTKSSIAYGVIDCSIKTLVVIITIMTFQTSFHLGTLTTIFAVCAMIALYLYKKYYSKKNSKLILFLCSYLILISVIGLLFDINRITLILYNFSYTVSMAILATIYDTKKGDIVKECHIEKWKTEWIVITERFINSGRIIGYSFMLCAGLFNHIVVFKILLLIVSLFAPVFAKLMYDVEK